MTQTVRLADGRTLAYVELGDPSGRPVVYCHGLWNSRLSHGPDAAHCRALGIRFVAPDRPGVGASDPAAPSGLSAWADDVAALADSLGLDRFGIAGFSGGGPFALACAAVLAERVTAVAVAGSFGPLDRRAQRRGLRRDLAAALALARITPALLPALFAVPARAARHDPIAFASRRQAAAPAADREVGMRPEVFARAALGTAEAVRCGVRGVARDFNLIARPWDFDPATVRVPTHVWHGGQDRDAPISMGRALAAQIPGAVMHEVGDAGHLVMCDRWDEVLDSAGG